MVEYINTIACHMLFCYCNFFFLGYITVLDLLLKNILGRLLFCGNTIQIKVIVYRIQFPLWNR